MLLKRACACVTRGGVAPELWLGIPTTTTGIGSRIPDMDIQIVQKTQARAGANMDHECVEIQCHRNIISLYLSQREWVWNKRKHLCAHIIQWFRALDRALFIPSDRPLNVWNFSAPRMSGARVLGESDATFYSQKLWAQRYLGTWARLLTCRFPLRYGATAS